MIRRLFAFLSALSLVLCAAAAARFVWVALGQRAAVKQTLAETKGQCGGALRSWRHTSSVVGADVTFDAGSLSVGAAEDVTATTGVFPASTRPGQIMDALSGRHVARSTTSRAVPAYHDSRISLGAGSAGGSYVEAVVLRAVANPSRTFFAVSDPIG